MPRRINTPVWDFVRNYADSGAVRAHMPGHKGAGPLGFERYDITEIKGADALYEADGIIEESRLNATALFGAGRTDYSTEGSSQSIRAMVALAATAEGDFDRRRPVILAARNVHKAFVYACALLDVEIEWLMPETARSSLCACPVTADGVAERLDGMANKPCALYITAPDYLGGSPDIASVAEACHQRGVPLLVDNAHGAYLKFLSPSRHPIDLGADICCDSAHKTLPVLTGGGYLHVSKGFLPRLNKSPRAAMALFGSTSPSYLILSSLDKCNEYLSGDFPTELAETCRRADELKAELTAMGYTVADSDPLKLTLFDGVGGRELADRLRRGGVEAEMADLWAAVMMFTPRNSLEDFAKIRDIFAKYTPLPMTDSPMPPLLIPERVMSPGQALLRSPTERVRVGDSVGRVCADPSVSCPPAIPIAVSGEIITEAAAELFSLYGIKEIEVVKEKS